MWDPQSDPLGIGLQASARQKRFELAAKGLSGGGSPIGPLPDPQWDAFFEAIGQKANGRPVRFGQSNAEGSDTTNADAADPNMMSRQLGTLSLSSLKRMRGGV